MSGSQALTDLADLCGILPVFHELDGTERPTSPETQKALLAANGLDVSSEGAIQDSLDTLHCAAQDRWFPEEIIVQSNMLAPLHFGLGAEWHLCFDGSDTIVATGTPADHITLPALPSGIYELTATASGRTEVIVVLVAPQRLPSLLSHAGTDKIWGLNAALYGLQSARNSGLGDFADLGQIAALAAAQGASFVGVNPLHTMGFSDDTAISPYSPSHRGFLNTSYIALDKIEGAGHVPGPAFDGLRDSDTIQYRAHKLAHTQQLEAAYAQFCKSAPAPAKAAFAAFQSGSGPAMADFARYEARSERHGADWRMWQGADTDLEADRIAFHTWLQWVANSQLASAQNAAKDAGMALGLYLDLAVGPRRDGAEAYCEQESIATAVSIGAPPDHLSPEGQNWDLAAFSPRKLKANRYAPLRRILAQTMRYAGVIRIDHVLGLNRSFWIPDDGSPGGYIRQPFESLLAIIKIEAERYNCLVIGEDLGLVPDGFRDTMQSHGFYGYSVLQYEKDDQGRFRDPADVPAQVLSCFATHDTPTLAGYEGGRDIEWWQKLGWVDAQTADTMRQERQDDVTAAVTDQPFGTTMHAALAQSGAEMVAVQLDDVLQSQEAQNLPGTIDQHPNWRRKYSVTLDDLPNDDRLTDIAAMMQHAGRASFKEEL